MWEIEKKLFIFLYVEKIGRVGRCEEGRRMQKKGESEWRGKVAKKQKKKRERSGHGFDTRLVFFCLLNGCDIIFSGIFPSNSSGISEFVKVAGNFFFLFIKQYFNLFFYFLPRRGCWWLIPYIASINFFFFG